MRFLALSTNGLKTSNGIGSYNGISTLNGLTHVNGLKTINGIIGPDGNVQGGWNSYFLPTKFSAADLGTNSIHPDRLGPSGVGDLSNVPEIEDNVLDNRFISPELKEMLCFEDATNNGETVTFRDYFSVLVDLAWPPNAEFRLCCSELAGTSATSPCLEPDYVFSSQPQVAGLEPLILAPHFLTQQFESGQQEALTAALIAKFNVLGQTLIMDLTGRFDLGAAGTRFIAGKEPGFDYYLGNAWGNMFLDCSKEDKDHVLCQASTEGDRDIGRDADYYELPMFTCDGQSGYPTTESGKACFSPDMETNIRDGCDWVSAVGPCNQVCVGGFCGVNDPPLEHRGTTNVLYIYMREYATTPEDESTTGHLGLKIALPLVLVLAIGAMIYAVRKMKKTKNATKDENHEYVVKEAESTQETGTDVDSGEEFVTCQIEA